MRQCTTTTTPCGRAWLHLMRLQSCTLMNVHRWLPVLAQVLG